MTKHYGGKPIVGTTSEHIYDKHKPVAPEHLRATLSEDEDDDIGHYMGKVSELKAIADRRLEWLKDAMEWAEHCPECNGWLQPTIPGIYGHYSGCPLEKELSGER